MALTVRLIGTRTPLEPIGDIFDEVRGPQVWGPFLWPDNIPIHSGWDEVELVTSGGAEAGAVTLTRDPDTNIVTEVEVTTTRTRSTAEVEFP